jgi:hypothetical protein
MIQTNPSDFLVVVKPLTGLLGSRPTVIAQRLPRFPFHIVEFQLRLSELFGNPIPTIRWLSTGLAKSCHVLQRRGGIDEETPETSAQECCKRP